MAHDVFISYSSQDKIVADAVCATLEGRKIRCWIAPRDVPAGLQYAAALVNAINDCKVFVLILSKGSNTSGQVLREVEAAVDNGTPIIPLRIEDFEPTDAMRYYIKSLHWLDAMSPPLERHLGKLADSVQALLSVGAEEQPPPVVETVMEAPEKKRWPLPTWATALLTLAAVVIVGGVGWLATNQLRTTPSTASPAPSTTNPTEMSSLELLPPAGWSEWRTLTFMFPDPQMWEQSGDNRYTAIKQHEADAFVWSTETFEGNLTVSLDLESAEKALDLGWSEMEREFPYQDSGCVIIYGDGHELSYGSLILCVNWDGYYLEQHTHYHEGENLLAFIPSRPFNKTDRVYSVTIEIIDDLARMYVNGEEVLSAFFDTEEIDRSGRIGLFRVWAEGEITFSNILIKTFNNGG